jgi:hypothetical protein
MGLGLAAVKRATKCRRPNFQLYRALKIVNFNDDFVNALHKFEPTKQQGRLSSNYNWPLRVAFEVVSSVV